MGQRERVRRASRGGSGRSRGDALRVCDAKQQQEQQSPPSQRPPCTDFDMAYFHSYAHVGIHEEMIKVVQFSF